MKLTKVNLKMERNQLISLFKFLPFPSWTKNIQLKYGHL